jgi:phosphatidylglycerophosphate synthase
MSGAPAARILRSSGAASSARDPAPVRIWGLTPEERLRRSLERAGCEDIAIVAPDGPDAGDAGRPASDTAVVCRGDVVLDERLVTALVEHPKTLLTAPELGPVAAHVETRELPQALALLSSPGAAKLASLRETTPERLAPAWLPNLRKREPAYVYAARPDRVREVEARTFAASYKGVTDLVTKWVWPKPAAAATRWCAQRGITPNAVTLASWVLAGLAFWLFWRGEFGVGLIAAWAMTFLDTVDGKLARVTLTSSRLGDVLDHGLDLLHPPFWYFAWAVGLGGGHPIATAVVVGGYVAGRLLEGAFLAAFRFETHSWRPLDGAFRTVTARRNPNLILLSVATVGGRPDLGLLMVALWTGVSLAFHTVRLLQAFAARRRGEPVAAWDAQGAAG